MAGVQTRGLTFRVYRRGICHQAYATVRRICIARLIGLRQIPPEFRDNDVSGKTKAVTGVDSLSKRQKEILRLVARHHQVKEIARLLSISEATVRTHTEEARRRLGAATSREAAIVLLRHESGDGSLSEHELLPDAAEDTVPESAARPVPKPATNADPAPARALPPVPETGGLSRWLRQRSALECVGVILLVALGLTLVLAALLASSVTLIQAIQNLTGQTH